MRVYEDGILSFNPQIPTEWKSYAFTINFRGSIIKVYKSQTDCKFFNESENEIRLFVNNKAIKIGANHSVTV
jgi:maltose phosphorylase